MIGTDASADPVIRPLHTLAELEACVRLQEEVWGHGFREIAPVSILKVGQRLGGLLGGALDPSGDLVGFVFGLTGTRDGRPVHWSHMLAVRPGLRNAGLGRRLKAWQRSQCLASGIDTVFWTFDPLESRNAWLNMGRLGAVIREYAEDMYGDSNSTLHAGLGTDRLVAFWLLGSDRVRERLEGRGAPPPVWEDVKRYPISFGVDEAGGLPRPASDAPPPPSSTDTILVPVPGDIHRVKATDPQLAAEWRVATRTALAPRIHEGWEVRELVRGTATVSYYLLGRQLKSE